jgi:hypothetical protein
MLKIRQFLNQVEDKFLFPFGRRTWQILSVVAILVVSMGILWFIFNSRPGTPVRVVVNKWEVVENEIDTIAYQVEYESGCSKETVSASLDNLKKLLPLLEWDSLGRLETKSYYLTDRYGNYIYDEDSWSYKKGRRQVLVPNEGAVPNLLNEIYKSRYIDSLDYCGQLQIISTIQLLVSLYDPEFLQSGTKFVDLCNQFEYYRKLDEYSVLVALRINKIVDNQFRLISDNETLKRFYEILQYVLSSDASEEKLVHADSVISAHRRLGLGNKNIADEYFEAFRIVQSADITNPKHFKRAIEDFIVEIKFYHEIGFTKSLRRYLNLYEDKLNWKENQKRRIQESKAANRWFALKYAGFAMLAIGIFTIILLLFSIQNILRKKME